jgi:RNA polymerase sigma factor (sigma-70 family)
MNVHFSYKLHRTPEIDREIKHGIEKLRKRLQVFRPELVHLKGSLEQNSAREGTAIALNLRLPSGQMAVQESAASATTALKSAFDELLGQVGKHKELLRSSHKWRRRRSPGTRPVAQVPFEDTIASIPPLTATGDDVRSYVNANFRRLETYVEREIFFRETSGNFDPGSVSAQEIVDEAVARALDESAEKPDRMGLEPWFYHLAIKSLDDVASGLSQNDGTLELEAPRARRRERASDEPRFQFHQPDESMTTESIIPDRGTATPEEIAYTDEIIALIQFALRGANPEDREAFVLHGLEGFSSEEIAAITDRTREEVERSIARARETLRRHFPASNPFARNPLQHTGIR